MTPKPFVSIVIPARNKLAATLRTLKSLEFQDYNKDDFEVILVEDGSKERIVKVLRSYTPAYSYRVISNIRQGSAARARNRGWREANGKIIIFLDNDIITHPQLIRNHIKHYSQSPDTLVVLGYRYLTHRGVKYPTFTSQDELEVWFSQIDTIDDERENFWKSQSTDPTKQWADWGCLYSHNFSLSKNLLEQVGGFDDNFDGCGGEDIELGYRLDQIGAKFIIARNALGYHQYHPRSAWRWKANFENIEKIAEKHPELNPFKEKVLEEWQKNAGKRSGINKPIRSNEVTYLSTVKLAQQYSSKFVKTVSVIVPTYNSKDVLAKTLEGLKLQTYPHNLIEVVIANDGSSDGLQSFIDGYKAPWNLKIVSQSDQEFRIASIRNKAIRAASGEVIINLDADMFPLPEFLVEHLKLFHVADNVVGIGHRRYVDMNSISPPIDADMIEAIAQLPDIQSSSNWYLPRDRRLPEFRSFHKHPAPYHLFHGCNLSYKKEHALHAGLYGEDFDGHWGWEDIEFGYRLWADGKTFISVPSALALHQENKVTSYTKKVSDDLVNFQLACAKIPGLREFKEKINASSREPWWL